MADRLAEEIRNGTRPPGSTLPHIPELVAAGEGSKATVHKAYRELESLGYVAARRGRGTVVLSPSPRVTLNRHERDAATPDSWARATAEQGLDGRTEAEPLTVLDAPADIAELLDVPTGTPAIRCRRRAMIGATVAALHEDWYLVSTAQAAGLNQPEQTEGDVLGLLTAGGIRPSAVEESVSVAPATSDQAAQLGIGPQSPVLTVDRITRDGTGRAIEVARLVGGTHRFRLVYTPLPRQVGEAPEQPR
ncbi:GntR family transcriptional regulator [Streptomyces sp. NPDC090442]|uniref:GntR family transcriptional regulator n=1 Tax=Streptomyces sp. NPDC090442 TaxID=3365962 RepID=UPI0038115C28